MKQIQVKRLQVVISTHSPTMIEHLPKEAIKVFHQLPGNGKFKVEDECIPEEAFYYIDQPISNKIKIIVEDILAKMIIDSVLDTMGEGYRNLFKIDFRRGGSKTLKNKHIPVYSTDPNTNMYFIFDGDEKKREHVEPGTIPTNDLTIDNLYKIIKDQTGCEIDFMVDSDPNGGGREDQKLELMKKYLAYYYTNVFYLPLQTPEDIIWDDAYAQDFLKLNSVDQSKIDEIIGIDNNKERIYFISKECSIDDKSIETFYKMFIKKWIRKEDENYQTIKSLIETIRAHHG